MTDDFCDGLIYRLCDSVVRRAASVPIIRLRQKRSSSFHLQPSTSALPATTLDYHSQPRHHHRRCTQVSASQTSSLADIAQRPAPVERRAQSFARMSVGARSFAHYDKLQQLHKWRLCLSAMTSNVFLTVEISKSEKVIAAYSFIMDVQLFVQAQDLVHAI